MSLSRPIHVLACGLTVLALLSLGGCPPNQPEPEIPLNTTDPTNGGATYETTAVCSPCHFNIVQQQNLTGHRHMLNPIISGPPVYPTQATRAGVPNPPPGFAWDDVSFVIGGYLHKANFVDSQGFLFTDGTAGVNTQWNLAAPAAMDPAGFASYLPSQAAPLPYTFDCFRCHTTGPSTAGHQAGLPGVQGTFVQPGIQCEACHGPGSRHVPNPPANIYVNPTAAFCGQCHSRQPAGPIQAANGFILNEQQHTEFQASPHAPMQCVTCHNPHASPNYDPANALVNDCQNCHADQTMALHAGKFLTLGTYTETLTCHTLPHALCHRRRNLHADRRRPHRRRANPHLPHQPRPRRLHHHVHDLRRRRPHRPERTGRPHPRLRLPPLPQRRRQRLCPDVATGIQHCRRHPRAPAVA